MVFDYSPKSAMVLYIYRGLLRILRRSQWPHGLRREFAAERLRRLLAQIKVTLRRYLNAHSFYCVDEFMCTDNL
jgi:hypothetical protein